MNTAVVASEDQPDDPYPGVEKGAILSQEEAERLTGQKIHPELFSLMPTGNLVFVVEEKLSDDFSDKIAMPQNMYKPPAGCGWVIAAGPLAGNEMYSQMVGVASIGAISSRPEDLLGLHILMGVQTGVPISLSLLDRKYQGQVVMMTSRDIQAIDLNPVSLVKRVQNETNRRGEASLIEMA